MCVDGFVWVEWIYGISVYAKQKVFYIFFWMSMRCDAANINVFRIANIVFVPGTQMFSVQIFYLSKLLGELCVASLRESNKDS